MILHLPLAQSLELFLLIFTSFLSLIFADLKDKINNTINNSYNTENLSYDDIGKVLVKIAANYFED